jgi:hypothetical protein
LRKRAEHVSTARANVSAFWRYIDMSKQEFDALPHDERASEMHTVLGLPREAVADRRNAVVSMSGLRDIFAFDWVNRANST